MWNARGVGAGGLGGGFGVKVGGREAGFVAALGGSGGGSSSSLSPIHQSPPSPAPHPGLVPARPRRGVMGDGWIRDEG